MNTKDKKSNSSGFVLLFAVTLSAILLSIALGVSNITLSEVKFDTNARDTDDAFFAADVGAECAFFYDRSDQNKFPKDGPSQDISCVTNSTIHPSYPAGGVPNVYSFIVVGLGSSGQSCAIVTVDKRSQTDPKTTITSDGYNNGNADCSAGSNTVEREIQSRY